MRKLTDKELAEPDVILTIPYDLKLPKDIWEDLSLYIGIDTGITYIYKLPAYFFRELEKRMQSCNQESKTAI